MTGFTIKGMNTAVDRTTFMPIVYTAPSLQGPWTLQDHAIFKSASVVAGSEGTDRLEFETPYGTVYSPLQKAFSVRPALNLEGQWARLALLDPDGSTATVFVGAIRGVARRVFGSDSDTPPAGPSPQRPKGFQAWSAFGGQLWLRLTSVSTAFFVSPPQGGGTQSAGVTRVTWTPGFNQRDSHGFFRGNRSSSPAADDPKSYVFGGTAVWTRRQAVDYVLKRFLNTSAKAPTFTLAGQLEVLDEDLRILDLGVAETVEAVLRRIIAHKEGIDFGVHPAFDEGTGAFTGYEITVFTLVADPVTFRSCTIPGNPNTVQFSTSDMETVEDLRVGSDRTHMPARIRLVGDRIVVCATLLGPYLAGPNDDILTSSSASLVGKWSSALEALYKAGNPSYSADDEGDLHDAYRARPEFETVYRLFGLPTGFARPSAWLPAFDGSGNPISAPAPYQDALRETLSWIPLLQGYDYSTNPPTNANPTTADVDVRAPFVIAEDRRAERALEDPVGGGTTSSSKVFADGAQLGLGHSVTKHDLGVHLHASPAHRLALGRGAFDGSDSANSRRQLGSDKNDPDDEGHGVDARTLAATIAWKSDARFVLEFVADAASDDGTALEVAVPEAQIWWLAPSTIVGIDAQSQPVKTGATGVVLRNDADLYAPQMAGLIARYLLARQRVDFTFHGWRPWIGLLGTILTTVEEGGETKAVNAPITSVELHGGENTEPRTFVRCGYAP